MRQAGRRSFSQYKQLKQLSATGDIADVQATAVPRKLRRSSWSMTLPSSPFVNGMGSGSMSSAVSPLAAAHMQSPCSHSAGSLPTVAAERVAQAQDSTIMQQSRGAERAEDCLLAQLLQERAAYQAEADRLRREVTSLNNQLGMMRFQHGVLAEEEEQVLVDEYFEFAEEPDLPGLSYSTAGGSSGMSGSSTSHHDLVG